MELIVDNATKIYKGQVKALDDFSLKIDRGVLGLLGPNGAGKSTLMRMISTITKPSSGSILLDNKDVVKHPNEIRKIIGYLPQNFGVYPNLNVVEFLEYLAAIKGINGKIANKRINELLELVNLSDYRKRPLRGYSGGMKQRVGIAQALLNDPKLLIVDEPTVGLDPEERIRFRNLISELSGDRIIILSTHIVSDIEASATDIAIIKKGRLILNKSPEKLLNEVKDKVWEGIVSSDMLSELRLKHLISSTVQSSVGVKIRIISATKPDFNASPVTPYLEDAYLYVISEKKVGTIV